jgi:hypothetical protein
MGILLLFMMRRADRYIEDQQMTIWPRSISAYWPIFGAVVNSGASQAIESLSVSINGALR